MIHFKNGAGGYSSFFGHWYLTINPINHLRYWGFSFTSTEGASRIWIGPIMFGYTSWLP